MYCTEREDAALSGSIRLRSEAQGGTVQAQALRWEDSRRRLVSGVRGDGLEADVRRKTIRFSGPSRHPGHGVRRRPMTATAISRLTPAGWRHRVVRQWQS